MQRKENIRNVAIIAHVDHGKTTLVDAMLKFTGEFEIKDEDSPKDAVLDSNPLERERGITILAKCTSVPYKNHEINIVDTPGHADFGSEVERVLQMVDGALLLVDAVDGPMPQTRFVLRKALALGLKPVVVINKMDKPNADPHKVLDDVFSLFMELGASDQQLDFPVVYACGRAGWAGLFAETPGKDIEPLFETVLKYVPAPSGVDNAPLQMQVTMLDYNNFVGAIGIGRIMNGTIKKGQPLMLLKNSGGQTVSKALKIEKFKGLRRAEADQAFAGDIIAVAGLEGINVGDTVCEAEKPAPLKPLTIDEPTIMMEFMVNDSPFANKEGKFVTSRHLKARLEKEAHTNVGLKVEIMEGEGKFKVSGRGELHLTVLIETMRREGFELAVSAPEVIYKNENGVILEPMEYLILDINSEYQGAVFESLGQRGAKLENMASEGEDRLRLEYLIPSRSLIGFKSEFLTNTRGKGVMHHSFSGYYPKTSAQSLRRNGVFVAKEEGITTPYALFALQDSGKMFVGPGIRVYEGMIVGQNSRDNDLVVNPCKEKKLTNMRSSATDESYVLTPPRGMSLEQAIEYIAEDELVEVTPLSIRLRKKILVKHLRRREYAKTHMEEEA